MKKTDTYINISKLVGIKQFNMISRIKKDNPHKYLLLYLGTQHKEEVIERADELYPWIVQSIGKDIAKYKNITEILEKNPTFKKKSVVNCLNKKQHYNTYMGFEWRYDNV